MIQLTDINGNVFGDGLIEIKDISGKPKSPPTTVVWGTITGLLSNQTDLQTALNSKENSFTVLSISKGGTNSSTALLNGRVMISSGGAIIEADTATYPTVLELSYVKGVTSPIQTQFTGKKTIATGNTYRFETTDGSGNLQETAVTASRAVVTDANGLPTASPTTATQIGYLSTTTSDVQTQINNITSAARYYVLTSDFSITTASETDITGYTATVEANSYYEIDIALFTGLSGGSTGIKFGFKFPTSSNFRISEIGRTTGSTAIANLGSAYTANTGLMALTYNTAAQNAGQVMMKAVLFTGANSGNLQMTMASANGAQTSTIFKNSLMKVTKFVPS